MEEKAAHEKAEWDEVLHQEAVEGQFFLFC